MGFLDGHYLCTFRSSERVSSPLLRDVRVTEPAALKRLMLLEWMELHE